MAFRQVRSKPAWSRAPSPWRQVSTANRYAQTRLAQLARQGYTPQQFGIQGNAAAQWRAISPILGALQAIRSGNPGGYRWNPGQAQVNPAVAAMLMQLLKPSSREYIDAPFDRTPPPATFMGGAGAIPY